MTRALLKIAGPLAAAALVAGCAGVRTHNGALLDRELVSSVQVGVDNKASVEKLLGRPSFTGQFDPNDWYYVSRSTSVYAFRNPRVLDQSTLRIRFDQAGNVVSVQQTGRELVASVDPTSRSTPTLGRNRGFFEEIFGNVNATPGGLARSPDQ